MTPTSARRLGFTLIELMVVVIIIGVLTIIALPVFTRTVEHAKSAEAVTNLAVIRQAELLHHARYDTFVEAVDLPQINQTLELDLSAQHFDYEISQQAPEEFLIVATSRLPVPGTDESLRVAMDQTGKLTYLWPRGGRRRSSSAGGTNGRGGTGGGTGGGGTGGGGSSGGGGGGSGGGGSSGSTGVTGDESPDIPADLSKLASASKGHRPASPNGFDYIPRGLDQWTGWSKTNSVNITGTLATDKLRDAFDLVAASGAHAITDDLQAKSVQISFANDLSDFSVGCQTVQAIACMNAQGIENFPDAAKPFILFNPRWSGEEAGILAGVLTHEGTHFQQVLDLTLANEALNGELTVMDIEFVAWWNAAVYWGEVRSAFLPIDTPLEIEEEAAYVAALQGEAALRDYFGPRYVQR